MGEWMETAVNILMLFTTGTAVLFVIMYILAKNPETKERQPDHCGHNEYCSVSCYDEHLYHI